ncbi:MAG: hypothetical protein WDA18_05630 [Candidatus Ratteibacteria bacterium]
MINKSCRSILILVGILSLFLVPLSSAEIKPMRIVAGYHETGATYFTCKARFGKFYQLFYPVGVTKKYAFQSSELKKYSMVVIIKGGEIEGSDIKNELSDFVQEGGTLVLAGTPAQTILPLLLPGASYVRLPKPTPVLFTPSGSDLGKGVPSGVLFSSDGISSPSEGTSLAQADNFSAIFEAKIGKGKLFFIGEHLFPPFGTVDTSSMFKNLPPALLEALHILNDNFFAAIKPPAIGEAIKEALKKNNNTRPFTIWFRDFDHHPFEGAEHLIPPVPFNEEIIPELQLEAGINETERQLFYTTSATPLPQFSCRILPLKGPAGTIPESQITLRAMERPSKNFVGPQVYLGTLEDISESGDGILSFDTPRTITWCLRVSCKNMAPGSYQGGIEFFNGSKRIETLPVKVTVLPFSLFKQSIDFSSEVFTYFHTLKKKEEQVAFMEKARDWREHYSTFGLGGFSTWGAPPGRIRSSGLSFHQAVEKNPELFRQSRLPRLEMGEEADLFFEILAKEGIPKYRGYNLCGPPIEAFLPLTKKVYAKENLTADSPENKALAQYWFSEYGRYIKEKGFTEIYVKIMDEWGPQQLSSFLRYATIAKGAGWKVIANPSLEGVLANRTLRNQLWDFVDVWWYAWNPAFIRLTELMTAHGKPLDPENGLWGCQTSSWWWNQNPYNMINYTWALSYRGFQGFHWHGWSRGNQNSAGVWLEKKEGKEKIFPSFCYEMMAEGLEEGEYLTLLRELAPEKAPAIIDTIIGNNGILAVTELKVDHYSMTILDATKNRSFSSFKESKKKLLTALIAVSQEKPKKPGLRWKKIALVEKGRPLYSLLYGKHIDEASLFAESIEKLSGAKLNKATGSLPSTGNIIVIGTRDEPLIKEIVQACDCDSITSRYPLEGSWIIEKVEMKGRNLLLLCGGDQEGLKKGIQFFEHFLTMEKK